MRAVAVAIVASLFANVVAHGQSLTSEAAVTTGVSSEEQTAVAATQVRIFGDATSDVRYFAEVAWGATNEADVDAFGAAYPYRNRVQIIEGYADRMFRPGGAIVGVKGGRYRPPFGISDSSDFAYEGFLRAPLIRYDGYFALSNNFLEQGADVIVGVPELTLETSIGAPADVGTAVRRSGTDAVLRVRGAVGSFILGASYIHTQPYQPAFFAQGASRFAGVDVRWMRSGVQLRGEWVGGRPFDGTSTFGWYGDAIVHRPRMGPVTAVARVERLAYNAVSPFDLAATRQTLGARVRITSQISIDANLIHQTGGVAKYSTTPFDIGVTYTIRRD